MSEKIGNQAGMGQGAGSRIKNKSAVNVATVLFDTPEIQSFKAAGKNLGKSGV